MFRAVIVAAVSTTAQAAEDRASLPQQIISCEECCARNGWDIVASVQIPGHSRNYAYLDEIAADCPPYADLLRIVRSGAVNLIVTAYYSRLWRTQELQSALMAVCRQHDVQVYSVAEGGALRPPGSGPVDSTSKFVASVHGYTAEHENEVRRERHASGMRKRIADGLHATNSGVAYGYRPVAGRRQPVVVEEREARWVRWIYERRAEGWGYMRIMGSLNDMGVPAPRGRGAWQYTTLHRMLQNDFYAGTVRFGDVSNPAGRHEAIIDGDLWRRVAAMNGRRAISRSGAVFPLSGLCRCGHCGWAMAYNRNGSARYLRCTQYSHTGGRVCVSNSQVAHPVEAAVMTLVRGLVADPATYWQQRQAQRHEDTARELAAVESEIESQRTRYQRLLDALEGGYIDLPTFGARAAFLDTAKLEARRDELRAAAHTTTTLAERLLSLRDVATRLDELADDELNRIYHLLIERVEPVRGEPPRVVLL